MKLAVVLGVVLPLAACPDRDRPEIQPDMQRPRRVIERTSTSVRELPPHAIHADGVGPYKIGERLDVLLAALPSGPRIATFDIHGVVHSNILHADDEAIVGGFGRFRGDSVCVIGHEKGSSTEGRLKHNFGMARPEGYRKAVRLMEMADRFDIPVISFVDTPGA